VEQAARGRLSRDNKAYQAALDLITELERVIDDTVDRFMFPSSEPLGSKSTPVIHIQTKPSLNSVITDQNCSSGPPAFPTSPSGSVFKARPTDLMVMFPATAMYVTANHPGWPDLHAAAARLRHDLGIRTGLWLHALDRLGRNGAAVTMMIMAERLARGEIRQSAGAYFSGMMRKACRNELDLGRSLWGFRGAVTAE
jgi:replication initiation protein RepC